MQLKGEEVYSYFRVVKEFVKPTSEEGDEWKGSKLMSLEKARKVVEKMFKLNTPENQYTYNLTTLNIVSSIALMKKKKLLK